MGLKAKTMKSSGSLFGSVLVHFSGRWHYACSEQKNVDKREHLTFL
jgi:hypothetical protein